MRFLSCCLVGALLFGSVACHDGGDVEVLSLSFEGANAFDGDVH